MRPRFLTFAVLGVILVAVGEWNLRTRKIAPIETLNRYWLEFCIGNAADKLAPPALTVVRIHEGYEPLRLAEDGPASDGRLSRLDFATILSFAAKLNPKSVAFLPIPTFDESLVLNQTAISPLKDAALQLPKFYVATGVSNDGEQAKDVNPLDYPGLKVEGDPASLLEFTRTIRHPDSQLLTNAEPAIKRIESARDLATAEEIRVPLVARHKDKVVPSIVLVSVAHHAGIPLDQVVVDLSTQKPVVRLGEWREVPIRPDGTFQVPHRAGLRRSMKSVEAGDDGKSRERLDFTTLTVDELAYTGEEEDEVTRRILSEFQGKFDSINRNLVVVGFDRTADRRFTLPGGETLSETMLLSYAMAAIQSGRFIEWWPTWARWIAIASVFLIAALIFRLARGKFLVGWFLTALAFFTACVLIFRSTLTWTPIFFAFALFLLMLLVGLVIPATKSQVAKPSEA